MEKCFEILDFFMKRPDAEPFLDPVPWKTLGLLDYPVIIKKPMDFNTIKKKLNSGKYVTTDEFANDIRLILDNCKLFNQDGSEFFILAEKLLKIFEKLYKKNILNQNVSDISDNDMNLETESNAEDNYVDYDSDPNEKNQIKNKKVTLSIPAKIRLTQEISKLNSNELGHVIDFLNKNIPSCLEKEDNKDDNVAIVIDLLDSEKFNKLVQYIAWLQPLSSIVNDLEKMSSSNSGNTNIKKEIQTKSEKISSSPQRDDGIKGNKSSKSNMPSVDISNNLSNKMKVEEQQTPRKKTP